MKVIAKLRSSRDQFRLCSSNPFTLAYISSHSSLSLAGMVEGRMQTWLVSLVTELTLEPLRQFDSWEDYSGSQDQSSCGYYLQETLLLILLLSSFSSRVPMFQLMRLSSEWIGVSCSATRSLMASSKLQSLMRTLDDTFQEVAFGMGYKPEDLLPIDRSVIEEESLAFTRAMAPREKEFYLNKKVTALMQRQNRILAEVEKEVKRKQGRYAGKLEALQPAAVQREIEQHRRMVERNQRYIDTLQRKQRIDQADLKRKISSSKHSRSQPSAQSQRSQRSQRSIASNASNRSDSSQRLLLVRQKQQEQEKQRRQILQQRQQELSKKSLKAEEELSRKSQRVKVRGEITTQIVRDNRRELEQLQRGEMREHLERLKFKIQKTETIRNKQKQQREAARTTIDLPRNPRPIPATAARYEDKERTASLRMSNQQVMKEGAREYNRMTQQIRTLQVRQNRQAKEKEEKLLLQGLLQHEQERMQTAEQKRNYLRDVARAKQIQQDIRIEVTRKNHQSLEQRRSLQKQQLQQRLAQKFEQIDQIGGLRRQLGEERRKISRVLARQRQSLQTSFQPEEVDSFFQPA